MVVNSPNDCYFTTREAACPVGSIPHVKSALQNQIELSRIEIASINEELEQLMDGGDLQLFNFASDPSNSSATVRATLLPLAPYISSKVKRAIITRNPALNPWHLCEILIACSPLNQDILELVDHENQLPQMLYDLLLSYQYGENGMIYKEINLKDAKMVKTIAIRDYASINEEEDEAKYSLENVMTLLEEEEDKYSWINKIDILRFQNNPSEASIMLDSYEEDKDREAWKDYFGILMSIDTIGGYIETANDYIGNLETLVASGKEGRHHAAALLEILTDSIAVEELNLPGLEPRSLKS